MKVTPEEIKELPEHHIFVFGSNEAGIHGAGAARLAFDKFGARLFQGFGQAGQSFAIPTKDWEIVPLGLWDIEFYVERFIAFAKLRKGDTFLVTKIGCGLAGFKPEDIAPLFADCMDMENVALPQEFIDIIQGDYEKINQHGRTEIYRDGELRASQG